MGDHERLYDDSERAKVRFVGFVSGNRRYDFGIVYTHLFFGKPLVICMQTGRSSLYSLEDIDNVDYLMQTFNLQTKKEAEECVEFFRNNLPSQSLEIEAE